MTNINIDTSMIHDNNKLLSRFKHERSKLDFARFSSSNNISSSTNESLTYPLELPNLLLRPKSIATTSIPSFGISNKIRGMAEKLRPQFQSSLTTNELVTQDQNAFDEKSISSIPSGDFESLNLSTQPGIKDLLISAEGLLSRLQGAYIQRTSALNDMIASRDNLIEELEESNTRAQNLRSQLGDLANSISKKDLRIAELEREILETKSTSCYCQAQFNRCHELQSSAPPPPLLCNSIDNAGTFSEDDHCNNHSTIGLETGNESDCESSTDDGIFSRPLSPALTNASSILIRSPYLGPVTFPSPPPSLSNSKVKINNNNNEKPKPQTNKSFFGFLNGRSNNKEVHLSEQENCINCLGRDSNAAWDTVSLLQVENQSLKGRIVELEDAIDGALNAIVGYY
ncbi:hypothetical protein OnM2_093010 [Erysiphe neolycopersici]|uniref:Uncharacterized protein n=1 Tax=Erysiphe neolycopersici TaxID=212602 RepID=A0A420HC67_9PEZI|nr:hypothetical protein OnM2_093010 [Erysiphe neolycopersici]